MRAIVCRLIDLSVHIDPNKQCAFSVFLEVPNVWADASPAAMKKELILLEEDKPLVLHLIRQNTLADRLHFTRIEMILKVNRHVLARHRFSLPVLSHRDALRIDQTFESFGISDTVH